MLDYPRPLACSTTHRAKLDKCPPDKCLSGQMSARKNVYQETCLPEHVDLDKDKCVPEHLALTKCDLNNKWMAPSNILCRMWECILVLSAWGDIALLTRWGFQLEEICVSWINKLFKLRINLVYNVRDIILYVIKRNLLGEKEKIIIK